MKAVHVVLKMKVMLKMMGATDSNISCTLVESMMRRTGRAAFEELQRRIAVRHCRRAKVRIVILAPSVR